ncbi:PspC domain-containing protein [Curtanaerobium respiraculi]|uniref:PspC domain-containing protein n=1 Tax=Curtanaerobium respiraculi TaxID=2949669 RepID=UPI0024B3C21E|nr:PspC domain-containing protein [Curtanaerobium respiraculi]
MPQRRAHSLYRSNDGPISGVCGGIANHWDVDATSVRLLAVALTVLSCGLAAFVYLALWLLLPREADVWCPVDVAPDQRSAACGGTGGKKPFHDRKATGILIALLVGLAVVSAAATLLLSRVIIGFPAVGFWALFAIALGVVRLVVPGRSGYTFIGTVEGGTLAFLGLVTLLALSGVISLRVDEWFDQNWPLLLIFAGLALQSRAIDSRAMAVAALSIMVLFCFIGLVFYVDIGPAAHHLGAGPIGITILSQDGALNV